MTEGTARADALYGWWSPFRSGSVSTFSHFEPRHKAPCHKWDSLSKPKRTSRNGNISASFVASVQLPWHIGIDLKWLLEIG